ncbi:protein kinase [Euzebya sp.]|uniref:protein kinase domain-containing protein n=1 Tax=Euzebya sp. TaxID=1971409 RepID=UPI00351238C0
MATDLGTEEFVDLVEIGRGGFGIVYTARQPAFDRTVAIKVLTLSDERTLRRFDRERQALGKVSNHPHITPVFASGFTAEGMPYLAMELMRGGSLADRLDRQGAMPWQEVLDLGVKMAGALETAHRSGILHRDLKPANILLSDFGEPRLADFGIASLDDGEQTKTGMITASVAYAAPEVLDGKRPEVAADVYGLGATLFTLVAGGAPFAADEDESILAMVLRVARDPVPDLRPRGVPGVFATALETAMAKSPRARYPTAAAVGAAPRAAQRALGLAETPMVLPQAPGAEPTADATVTYARPGGLPVFDTDGVAPPVAASDRAADGGTPAVAPAGPAEIGPVTGQGGPPPGATTRRSRRAPALLALVGVLLVVAVGAVVVLGSDGDDGDGTELAAGAAGPAQDEGAGDPAAEDGRAEDGPAGGTPADTAAATPATDTPEVEGADAAGEGSDGATGMPAPSEWQAVRSMRVARQQIPAVTLQGTIWITGGLTEDGVTTSVEGYEPATNSWRTGPDLPLPLHHQMSAVFGGEVVVLGGWAPEGSLLSAITSDQVFALRGDEWVELPPLLQPRAAGAAATVGDLLVVTGGQDSAGELIATTEVFDGESWREVAPLPTPREHLALVADDQHVYAVGGRELSSDANLATLERYDPATDTWEPLPDMPTARGGLAAAMVEGTLVAIGGEQPLGVFAEVEAYDVAAGTWTAWPSLPIARHGLAASASADSIFTMGGALEATHAAPTADAEVLALR